MKRSTQKNKVLRLCCACVAHVWCYRNTFDVVLAQHFRKLAQHPSTIDMLKKKKKLVHLARLEKKNSCTHTNRGAIWQLVDTSPENTLLCVRSHSGCEQFSGNRRYCTPRCVYKSEHDTRSPGISRPNRTFVTLHHELVRLTR